MNDDLRKQVEAAIFQELKDNQATIAQIQNFSVGADTQWSRGTEPGGTLGFVLGPVWSFNDMDFREVFISLPDALMIWFLNRLSEGEDWG